MKAKGGSEQYGSQLHEHVNTRPGRLHTVDADIFQWPDLEVEAGDDQERPTGTYAASYSTRVTTSS